MGDVISLQERRPTWLVVREKCRACFFCAVCAVEQRSDLDHLECGRCHAMESAVTHFMKDQGPDGLAEHRRVVFAFADDPEPEWTPRLVAL